MMRVRKSLNEASRKEMFHTAEILQKQLKALRDQDPLCRLEDALAEAVENEDYVKAAELQGIREKVAELDESHLPASKGGRLLFTAAHGSDLAACNIDGGDVRRPLGPEERKKIKESGQIQQPCWSRNGEMLAFTVLKVGTGAVEASRIVVVNEITGEKVLKVKVPNPPFFLMWLRDNKTISYMCNDGVNRVQLVELDTSQPAAPQEKGSGKQHAARIIDTGQPASKFGLNQFTQLLSSPSISSLLAAPCWQLTQPPVPCLALAPSGAPLFYSYSKIHNDIVVHNGSKNGVFRLERESGAWTKLSDSHGPQFMAPQPHAVGGTDAVIVVEDGHLVSVTTNGNAKKKLLPVKGFSSFGISPDQSKVCLMQQDLATGFYSLAVLQDKDGETDALDPTSAATLELKEIPIENIALAFFFSPDSKKLLLLSTQAKKGELAVARGFLKRGSNLGCSWMVYDLETNKVTEYARFHPRPFFVKVYLPFLDQFQLSFTPWSPDSTAFCFASIKGGWVQRLAGEGDEKPPVPTKISSSVEVGSWSPR
ncbi:unnamed protein product [Chrysoparadoxa australica]